MQNRVYIGCGSLQGDAFSKPSARPDHIGVIYGEHCAICAGPQIQWKPQTGTVSVEALRHDADERPRLAVQEKTLAENTRIAIELRLPQLVVHHEHNWGAGLGVIRSKIPAEQRRNSEKLESIGADVAAQETARAFCVAVQHIQLIVGDDIFEDMVLVANGQKLGDGVVITSFGLPRACQI